MADSGRLAEDLGAPDGAHRPPDEDALNGLAGSLMWLVRLRWVAVVGLSAALLVARALGVIEHLWLPLAVVAGLAE